MHQAKEKSRGPKAQMMLNGPPEQDLFTDSGTNCHDEEMKGRESIEREQALKLNEVLMQSGNAMECIPGEEGKECTGK